MRTRSIHLLPTFLAVGLALAIQPAPAAAQFGKLLKKAAQKQVEQAAVDKAMTAAAGGAPMPADTQAAPALAPASATPAPVGPAESTATAPADAALWVNYDFVPGDRVIFYTDYAEDEVGNFPQRLELREGNMEVAELGSRRLMRVTSRGILTIPLPEVLPQRFTIEIDVINRPSLDGWAFGLQGQPLQVRDGSVSTIGWGSDGLGIMGGGGGEVRQVNDEASRKRYRGKPAQLRILGDGKYIKAYLDERRLVNVPNASFGRSKGLNLVLEARGEENPIYVGRIRVAESRKSIYDDLAKTGRVATQGILFDTGSDQLRPESAPTLKEIAGILAQHATLRLRIEGHTDNMGDAAANLALSDRRAAAVRAALVSQYQVDAARLESSGLGDTKPVGPNTTAEGRQNNRRVELVRL
jgi:OOP family OmpA-OmpF porin